MDGKTDWTKRTLEFGVGENTVKWVYYKDRTGSEGEDCAWVDGIVWTPSGPADVVVNIGGTAVTVPGTWLAENTMRAATDMAANGRMSVAECYVVGLDPEDTTNEFRITSFPLLPNGTLDLEHLEFVPPQSKWNVQSARPVIKGAANLNDAIWPEVTEQNKAGFRFFKVTVELP